jgi:prepilin-type N-terminal cleavage/methylation domain-containing protein
MRNPMSAVDSDKGFTILELLTVILIISTVFAIAIPSYVTWRQSVEFRTTARAIAAILRDARSRAILSNLQHRVEFETGVAPAPPGPTGRYRMTQGDRAANSSTWGTAVQGWATTPNSVTLNFNSECR